MLLWTFRSMYLFKLVFSYSLDIYPVGITGSPGSLAFNWEGGCLHFTVSATIYIPTKIMLGLVFFTSPTIFVICAIFDDRHSDKCEVISHCGFAVNFLDIEWYLAPFHVLVGHLYIFFGKMSIQVFCSFLIGLFFHTELYELFIYFGY